MAMLQMEYELIQDALKKLPQSMKLKNALMNVILKVKEVMLAYSLVKNRWWIELSLNRYIISFIK